MEETPALDITCASCAAKITVAVPDAIAPEALAVAEGHEGRVSVTYTCPDCGASGEGLVIAKRTELEGIPGRFVPANIRPPE
jgi:hypothetical protein